MAMNHSLYTVVALLVFHGVHIKMANSELVMVYSVTRHAARNVLPKSANLSESEATGGPSLLAKGHEQAAKAGAGFKARYIDASTCANATQGCLPSEITSTHYGLVGTPRVGFTNYNTLANSSALDRTLATASGFLDALFPPPISFPVPVYSVAESEDYKIRGYTRCPAYQKRLQEWYTSAGFKSKEDETQELRARISSIAPSLNTSLANWWNVYDAFNVWQTYRVGDAMPDLDPKTYAEVSQLAMWLELSKMRSQMTGNLLGGALLGEMLVRLQQATTAWQQQRENYYKLLPVFAHYNTQLGLLSALKLDQYPPAASHPWLTTTIPAAAAILSLELHCFKANTTTSAGRDCFVRLVAQDGPSKDYGTIPLPCSGSSGAATSHTPPRGFEGACSYDAFVEMAQAEAMLSVGDWCRACDNNATNACRAALAEAAGVPMLSWSSLTDGGVSARESSGSSSSSSGMGWKIAVAVIVSVFGTVAIIGLAIGLVQSRKKRESRSQHQLQGGLLPVASLSERYNATELSPAGVL